MLREIYIIDELADTPASCYIGEGVMLVSSKHFLRYPVEYRFFILLHEYAHIVSGSSNEENADALAFEEYAKRGYSLRKLIACITDVLTLPLFESHRQRAVKLLIQAENFQEHGNYKA